MALIRWLGEENSLFRELDRMQREFDRLLSWNRPSLFGATSPSVYPPMNIYDDGESFIVRAEVPGVDPKDLDVSVANDTLTIKGQRVIPECSENACYHRQERAEGEFRRAFTLSDRVDSSKVMAEVKNGILEVRLPRAESAKARRIQVKSS